MRGLSEQVGVDGGQRGAAAGGATSEGRVSHSHQTTAAGRQPRLPNDHRRFSHLRLYASWSLLARANQMDIHKIPLPNVWSEFQALASKVLFAWVLAAGQLAPNCL